MQRAYDEMSSRNEAGKDQHDHAAFLHRMLGFKQTTGMHHAEKSLAVNEACAVGSTDPDPQSVTDDKTEVRREDRLAPRHAAVINRYASWDEKKVLRDVESDSANDEGDEDKPRAVLFNPS